MTKSDTWSFDVQQNKPHNPDAPFLDGRVRDMVDGLTEAIDREVERRRREGLPIHVAENGRVVNLQRDEQSERNK